VEDNIKVVIKVNMSLPVSTVGLTDKQVFDAVETIRKSTHERITEMTLMKLFNISTDAFIEDI
jgi:hypothetical protein